MSYNYTTEAMASLENEQSDIAAIVNIDEFDNVSEAAEKILNILKTEKEKITKKFYDYIERYIVTKYNVAVENIVDYILQKQKQRKEYNGSQQLLTKQRLEKCIKEKMIPNKRDFVFKLAFILEMTPEETNELLTKGMQERGFNFKNPLEVIYWYCLKFDYGFIEAQQLLKEYDKIEIAQSIENDKLTVEVRENFTGRFEKAGLVKEEYKDILLDCLKEIKQKYAINFINDDICNMRLKEEFMETLKEVRENISRNNAIDAVQNGLANLDRKAEGKAAESFRFVGSDSLASLYDVSKYLYRDIPDYEIHGVESYVADNEEEVFKGIPEELKANRLTKARLHFIAAEGNEQKRYPQRKDLITILFLNYNTSDLYWNEEHSKADRMIDFQEFVDDTLDRCGLASLNRNNIYEYFILLCMYANEPLEVFQEVYIQSIFKTNEENVNE